MVHIFNPNDIEKQESGFYFMKDAHRPGLLPKILTELVTLRSKVRGMINDNNSKMYNMILDMRQLAIKVVSNILNVLRIYKLTPFVGCQQCLWLYRCRIGYDRCANTRNNVLTSIV
uniref:DNA-directed DNA polymerase n=1 Tax=Clandestinovirus TaxID=2831644 RepID=A0A8F8KR49_9VIRU|nr:replicative polymerase delta family B [Clandestinovirus]